MSTVFGPGDSAAAEDVIEHYRQQVATLEAKVEHLEKELAIMKRQNGQLLRELRVKQHSSLGDWF